MSVFCGFLVLDNCYKKYMFPLEAVVCWSFCFFHCSCTNLDRTNVLDREGGMGGRLH